VPALVFQLSGASERWEILRSASATLPNRAAAGNQSRFCSGSTLAR